MSLLPPLGTAPPKARGLRYRLLSGAESPTADLYFALSHEAAFQKGLCKFLSPTVVALGSKLIVFRHTGGVDPLPSHDDLTLVLDDDIVRGIADPSLPLSFRARLRLLDHPAISQLAPRAARIVVASDVLAQSLRESFPKAQILRLDPAWPRSPAVLTRGGRHIGVLAGRSHAGDAKVLWPRLLMFLAMDTEVRLTVSRNLSPPRRLTAHPQVETLPAMSWRDYRNWLAGARLDLFLYPNSESPFNAARSLSKLAEADQLGAALISLAAWPAAEEAIEARRLLVAPSPDALTRFLAGLMSSGKKTREIAKRNRSALLASDPGADQRRFWAGIFPELAGIS